MAMTALPFARTAAVLLAVGWARAQDPQPRQGYEQTRAKLVAGAKANLQAKDLATLAWAAHAAAEYRLTECVPDLVAALEPQATQPGAHAEYAALAVLDALVETGAAVPGKQLVPFLDGWAHDPALLLLGRAPEANRALLLEQFRKEPTMGDRSIACGTWLADIGATELVRELLLGPVTIDVLVSDAPEGLVEAVQMDALILSHFRPRVPAGFPHTLHHLHIGSAADAGSICTQRVEYLGGFCLPFNPFDPRRRGAHDAWLRRLLGDRGKGMTIERAPLRAAKWDGADAMRTAVAGWRAESAAAHAALVDACVDAKLVAADAVPRTPAIRVQLFDYRSKQGVPLPSGPEWTIVPW